MGVEEKPCSTVSRAAEGGEMVQRTISSGERRELGRAARGSGNSSKAVFANPTLNRCCHRIVTFHV
jgi:hypothetical protein